MTRLRRMVLPVVAVAVVAASIGFAILEHGDIAPTPQSARSHFGAQSPSLLLRRPAPPAVAGLLQAQRHAVADGDRSAWLGTWGGSPAQQRLATRLWANLRALAVVGFAPRVAGPATAVDGTSGWRLPIILGWAIGDPIGREAQSKVSYEFVLRAGRPVVTDISAVKEAPKPIWLVGRVAVSRTPRTLAVAPSKAAAERLGRLLRTAVGDVDRVLPGWHGTLVAYLPGTTADFVALTAARPGEYTGIAAVTATVDGSRSPAAPAAIILNPAVFAGLGSVGAHVVVSHEATHLATGVAARPMPAWVAEGFADYVAIGSVHVPVAESAARAVAAVRANGVPTRLPDAAAFRSRPAPLEAVYEEAWLANRLIARTYGQQHLVAFYRAVRSRPDQVAAAFREVLHTTPGRFTAAWQRALLRLAHG